MAFAAAYTSVRSGSPCPISVDGRACGAIRGQLVDQPRGAVAAAAAAEVAPEQEQRRALGPRRGQGHGPTQARIDEVERRSPVAGLHGQRRPPRAAGTRCPAVLPLAAGGLGLGGLRLLPDGCRGPWGSFAFVPARYAPVGRSDSRHRDLRGAASPRSGVSRAARIC